LDRGSDRSLTGPNRSRTGLVSTTPSCDVFRLGMQHGLPVPSGTTVLILSPKRSQLGSKSAWASCVEWHNRATSRMLVHQSGPLVHRSNLGQDRGPNFSISRSGSVPDRKLHTPTSSPGTHTLLWNLMVLSLCITNRGVFLVNTSSLICSNCGFVRYKDIVG